MWECFLPERWIWEKFAESDRDCFEMSREFSARCGMLLLSLLLVFVSIFNM